jgi:hypothetical protein
MNDHATHRRPVSWLEPVLLLAVASLIVWLGFAGQSSSGQDHQQANSRMLAQADMFQRQLESLQAKASHYLNNAPRQYDHYFRDTTISHAHLQTDIDLLETQVQALISLRSMQPTDNGRRAEPALIQLQQQWAAFGRDLQEQLGVDPEMPRLEWAARHITEEARPLITSVTDLRGALQGSVQAAETAGAQRPSWAWPAFAAWLLAMLAWFGMRVRRRQA